MTSKEFQVFGAARLQVMSEQSKPKEEVVHTETDSRNYQHHCVEVGIVTF